MNKAGSSSTIVITKRMCHSTSDTISHLPGNVLDTILMGLPLQDVVRTSVLSTKWRYVWTKHPQLVFDDMFCRGPMKCATMNKLMMTIYKVLLLHKGPVLKFTLSLAALESCPEIDQLICFLSSSGIQEFTLYIRKGEIYKLPSSLFSCLQLKHLNLSCCMLKPPPGFKGFSRLLSLHLCKVGITTDVLSSLISSCPLLERLKLESSARFDCLEIVAPNLRIFCCMCPFISICFRSTPQLAEVTMMLGEFIQEYNCQETSYSVMLFDSLPVIEFLKLDYYYAECMAANGVPPRLPTTLNHLKYLTLDRICFGELDEVSFVLCLIRSSPNMKEITIRAFDVLNAAIDPVLELLEAQDWSGVSLNQLHRVEMRNISGRKPELKFIKLLLAKSPMLENFFIVLKPKAVAEELRIVKELIGFQRASPHAKVTF